MMFQTIIYYRIQKMLFNITIYNEYVFLCRINYFHNKLINKQFFQKSESIKIPTYKKTTVKNSFVFKGVIFKYHRIRLFHDVSKKKPITSSQLYDYGTDG